VNKLTNLKLSKEEQTLLADFESGIYESVLTDERKDFLQKAATETYKKDKRINIRISNRDLKLIKRRALEEGIPYQTLVSSVLHKYVSGSFLDLLSQKKQINQIK